MTLAQKYLKKVPQYTRNARHLWALAQHGTPRKFANLARVEFERRSRRIERVEARLPTQQEVT